jgi:hypothetical protein
MSTVDLTPIIQPILTAAGVVVTGVLAIYVPKAIAAFQARTGIMLTDQQRATVTGAINTGAGILETDLDKGAISVAHINVTSDAVATQARAVINAVPTAAAALGMTPESVARIIVGAVDTAAHPGPVAPVVPAAILMQGTVT